MKSILDEAKELTSNIRQSDYGHPKFNFDCIAELLTTYFKRKGSLSQEQKILGEDIPIIMILTKVAREAERHKRDNMTDIAGYANTREMYQEYGAREICDMPGCPKDATVYTVIGHPTIPIKHNTCYDHRDNFDHEDPSHVPPSPSSNKV